MIYAILQTILNLFLFVLGLLCVCYMIGVMVESNESDAATASDADDKASDADKKPSAKPVLQPPKTSDKTSDKTTTRTPKSKKEVDDMTPTRYKEALYHLVDKISMLSQQQQSVQPPSCMSLQDLQTQLQDVTRRILNGDESAETEREADHLDNQIRNHPDNAKDLKAKEEAWVKEQRDAIDKALKEMLSMIPDDATELSVDALVKKYGLPRELAKRIYETKILRLLTTPQGAIQKTHAVDLRDFSNQGLDIVEMRAVYGCLPAIFDLDGDGKKALWRQNFVNTLKDLVKKETNGKLTTRQQRHPAYANAEARLKTMNPPFYVDPDDPNRARYKDNDTTAIAKCGAFEPTQQPGVSSENTDAKTNHNKTSLRKRSTSSTNPMCILQAELKKKAAARQARAEGQTLKCE